MVLARNRAYCEATGRCQTEYSEHFQTVKSIVFNIFEGLKLIKEPPLDTNEFIEHVLSNEYIKSIMTSFALELPEYFMSIFPERRVWKNPSLNVRPSIRFRHYPDLICYFGWQFSQNLQRK